MVIPEVGEKQKTEREKEEKKGETEHWPSYAWHTQAAWANYYIIEAYDVINTCKEPFPMKNLFSDFFIDPEGS